MQLETSMHLETRGRLPLEQTAALTAWIGIAKWAENAIQNTMAIARNATTATMANFGYAHSYYGPASVTAHPSQAESTLT